MRSFGKWAAAVLIAAVLGSVAGRAQSTHAADLYQQAYAREALLRKEIDARPASSPATADLLQRIRTLAKTYEDLWRLFPTSGYSDNALWQGAVLAADAYFRFGDPADRVTATRLFQALPAHFPTSSLGKQVPAQLARLQGTVAPTGSGPHPVAAAPTVPGLREGSAPARRGNAEAARPQPGADTPRAASAAPTTSESVLTAIRRDVLPDVLRVTLQLEREPVFFAERIDGPPRVFIDMQHTRASTTLRDAVLPFPDDLVRQIRVGRQLNGRTRVVLDLSGAGNYSVYSLYNPYRIVIDFERTSPAAQTQQTTAKPRPTVAIPAPTPDARLKPGTTTNTTTGTPAQAPVPPSANSTGTFSLSRQLGLGVARIVIDAGHGGHDPGAKVNGLTEAELTLDVALRLENLLAKQSGVEVVLTRRTDAYVPLEERTAVANRSGADLFLSIHVNASDTAAARGVETYFLNFAPNPEAEAIAARENASSARTMGNLPDIVKAIAMNNKIDESRDFATMVQTALYDKLRATNKQLRNLGVKQAPFMVLIGATMPSILAEISFITNRQEGALLKTEKYRQQIAEALFQGVMRYQQSLKKAPAVASNSR